jgi:hypothetical protein
VDHTTSSHFLFGIAVLMALQGSSWCLGWYCFARRVAAVPTDMSLHVCSEKNFKQEPPSAKYSAIMISRDVI